MKNRLHRFGSLNGHSKLLPGPSSTVSPRMTKLKLDLLVVYLCISDDHVS